MTHRFNDAQSTRTMKAFICPNCGRPVRGRVTPGATTQICTHCGLPLALPQIHPPPRKPELPIRMTSVPTGPKPRRQPGVAPEVIWLFIAGIGVGIAAMFIFVLVPAMVRPPSDSQVQTPTSSEVHAANSPFHVPPMDDFKHPEPTPTLSRSEIMERTEPSVVRIDVLSASGREGSVGSGFFVHETGIVATNYHVIKGAARGVVTLSDQTELPINRFMTLSESKDLALLSVKLQGHKVASVRLAHAEPKKGEDVLAVGTPHGLDFSWSQGIVSAVRSDGQRAVIQHDAAISSGSSGGPLINMRGEVVGINTFVLDPDDSQNLNFAVSVLELLDLLQRAK